MKITKSNKNVKAFIKFMKKRHNIYLERYVKKTPYPWTKDVILNTYKFTNVYRELDRVTIWVKNNIRQQYKDHKYLWFMLCIFRQINWPPTIMDMLVCNDDTWPYATKGGVWDYRKAMKVMRFRKKKKLKVYTGAYILNAQYAGFTNGKKIDKPEFTCKYVLNYLWKDRVKLTKIMEEAATLQEVVEALLPYPGWGGFTAYEVACDMRYTRYLKNAKDKLTYANPGPGAMRGMNRILERELHYPGAKIIIPEMVELLKVVSSQWLVSKNTPKLELREIEHCLCEFDKYERVRLGQGRPRSKFTYINLKNQGIF